MNSVLNLEQDFCNIQELYELSIDDKELLNEVSQSIYILQKNIDTLEVESLFKDEMDYNDCFLEIHAGAGGTESNDWANMLLRMYTRWAEINHGFKISIIDKVDGDSVGIKSITLKIKGEKAYGWSKSESGVHRLVRISPFDANKKRHTSFASISVSPVIDSKISIDIAEIDLRIDTYKSSGAGGQHVNTTDSAVRITHISTGIVVQCQNERSQHKNKAAALSILKSKLYALEKQKQVEQINKEVGEKLTVGWGSQIRSYVFQPYQMVKDLRTNYEIGNIQSVMDGSIDGFIKSFLSMN